MNRDYFHWLETLPCNRKPQKANQWMSEWAPLPEHVDLPRHEEIQQEWNQRDRRLVVTRIRAANAGAFV